ncbi:hypothetical protein [Sinomonas sp. G460-2]|uniref:hypothetical protein n=1 Tax=Sinomonas sp. G460-2 TaxID=3393464 RepID=UPI0039F0EB04
MSAAIWQTFLDLSQIVTAAMAVAGVVVAAVLGWRGVRLAGSGVDRGIKDHLAARAMECSGAMTRVYREVAQLKGALHPYWKGEEFTEMEGERLTVIERESQVHERKYLLDAELAGLRASLDGMAHIFDGSVVESPGGQAWGEQVAVAKARTVLMDRAFFPHYFSLVTDDDGWGKDEPDLWLEVQTLGASSEPRDAVQQKLFDEWFVGRGFDASDDLSQRSIALLEDMTLALNDQIVKITGQVLRYALPIRDNRG